MMRCLGWCARLAVLVLVGSAGGCQRCGSPSTADAGVLEAAAPGIHLILPDSVKADPVAALLPQMPRRSGACAQVRSVKDRAVAEGLQKQISKATSLPVELLEADLGARGVWWRLCVGDEVDEARLTAAATRWTAPGGVLDPFLDPPVGHEPRFFVHTRQGAEARRPTAPQALAILERAPVPSSPVLSFGNATDPLLAATVPASDDPAAAPIVIAVDSQGTVLPVDASPPPGCAACLVAERESAVVARRALAVGDLGGPPGDELLIEERTGNDARFVSAVVVVQGRLRRVGAVLVARSQPGLVVSGDARIVEANGGPPQELAAVTTSLHVVDDRVCAIEEQTTLWRLAEGEQGLQRLETSMLQTPTAIVDAVTALDGTGDRAAASRVCAQALARNTETLVVRLCLGRVRMLMGEGAIVEATNAAGLLAEAAPGLRAALAAPMFAAVSALEADPRLSAAASDCERDPLVPALSAATLGETLRVARTRRRERVGLADVVDAVFVSGTRDFGPGTPVGGATARWLERLRVSQPARFAAIEALLLPPPDAGVIDPSSSGFGGNP